MTNNQTNIKMSFRVPESAFRAVSEKNGTVSLAITAQNGDLSAQVYYDFREVPLTLRAAVQTNDAVELILLSHRIELWVNGALCDEEWPAGDRLFAIGDFIDFEDAVTVEVYEPQPEQLPAVLGTFAGAEGWRPEENVFVGDCMPYVNRDRYHVLYLKDRHHHQSKWGFGAHQWAHISTADFENWEIHPLAVEITDPKEGSICTGSWIKNGSTEYLFYTVRMADWSPALICRSISDDGYHFRKDPDFHFALSDKYNKPQARDPKVFLGEDGLFHMILTTTLIEEKKGCLAHLVSRDLDTWEETEPIYVAADETHPECPDYIRYNDRYYLICSLHSRAHYQVSERPFDGWQMPADPIIPCSSVPKGAVWNGKIVFAGFTRSEGGLYAGTLTFRSAIGDADGILQFE